MLVSIFRARFFSNSLATILKFGGTVDRQICVRQYHCGEGPDSVFSSREWVKRQDFQQKSVCMRSGLVRLFDMLKLQDLSRYHLDLAITSSSALNLVLNIVNTETS